MDTRENIVRLRRFVKALVSARVNTRKKWHEWRKQPENEAFMAECFQYERLDGMPSITHLVLPFFHPSLPLIGLNYTQTAHNTLHQFKTGWTRPLRLCRGIIFDRRGSLVALPFPKFFNAGEHEETTNLPDEPFVATLKHDGHLGIIFNYRGRVIATTRGSFRSSSAKIANQMLVDYDWVERLPPNVTALVEIIHPDTKVIVDYGTREEFILLGAYNRRTLRDLRYPELRRLAKTLTIPVAKVWSGSNIAELEQVVANKRYLNEEGFVVRFQSGLRVKYKYKGYIGEMIGRKLTLRYVMNRLINGTFERTFSDLPGEIQVEARSMRDLVMAVADVDGTKKDAWKYLYELVEADERTPYYRQICRNFYKWLTAQSQAT